MNPAEESKLLFEVTLFQGHDKTHEADSVQREADNPVICREKDKLTVAKHHMLPGLHEFQVAALY